MICFHFEGQLGQLSVLGALGLGVAVARAHKTEGTQDIRSVSPPASYSTKKSSHRDGKKRFKLMVLYYKSNSTRCEHIHTHTHVYSIAYSPTHTVYTRTHNRLFKT